MRKRQTKKKKRESERGKKTGISSAAGGVGSRAASHLKSMGKADLMEMVLSDQRLEGILRVVEDLAVHKTHTFSTWPLMLQVQGQKRICKLNIPEQKKNNFKHLTANLIALFPAFFIGETDPFQETSYPVWYKVCAA